MPSLLANRHRAFHLAASGALLGLASLALGQPFNCGSTGADGALTFAPSAVPVTINFDPATFSPPLDADGDGVYHFTTVTIPENVTVKIRAPQVGWTPLYWLCQGNVTIAGTLDLNGDDGHAAGVPIQQHLPSVPGPGGYPGGWGHVLPQGLSGAAGFGSGTGNIFCQPLRGGNGGPGDGAPGWGVNDPTNGRGGGGGGGAILIASNTAVTLNGTITAAGGAGLYASYGGMIRIVTPTLNGSGSIVTWIDNVSIGGFVRFECTNDLFTGTIDPITAVRRVTLAPSATTLLPPAGPVSARLVRINGVPVPSTPTGAFAMPPDILLNTAEEVAFEVEARGIPLGTPITIFLWNETNQVVTFDTAGLEGTVEASTGTATRAVPNGWSRGFIYAQWTP